MYTDQDIANLVARVQQLEQMVANRPATSLPQYGFAFKEFPHARFLGLGLVFRRQSADWHRYSPALEPFSGSSSADRSSVSLRISAVNSVSNAILKIKIFQKEPVCAGFFI